ncbi:conserved Plasmodium protein, unknown function [Plasmodium malariae]|uniref:Uncharacterized protein n=1 Tax=Plasmodium malariae TaxID=5858 RepID=A0A1A8WT80_PLAMA|nr:conserved Plasmodium protein, unknown function [Plasmodium malariae]SBS95529.1 conserved Plasmodium protein, unknown function [Plasmodium malariae]SBT86688.1 conserved Plasmodium protein, unknown function [Plasmodium malariae]
MNFSGGDLTPIEPPNSIFSTEHRRWQNERNNKDCNNELLLKVIKNEMSYKQLPSKILLMTSKIYNIKNLFDEFSKDKKISKILQECGSYTYLKNLNTVIFTIHENADETYMPSFLQLLINNDVCIEFDQSVEAVGE